MLTQVRHQTVHSVSDVRDCYIGDKRIWLRIRDPMSCKRKLSEHSSHTLKLFHAWLAHCPPAMSIWPKQYWPGICVADAFASGELAGIGGIIEFPSHGTKWFSLRLSLSDFRLLDIPVHNDLQKDITSLETLAQIIRSGCLRFRIILVQSRCQMHYLQPRFHWLFFGKA